ncbi:nucleotidyl transferase AbiEii/AbiGii toxin family protein [Patescibacteria group bacterium]|nr:nucleotidyl transferase AbiEii/AbiGii toxin family protein [Patescibacteria group bacterium]
MITRQQLEIINRKSLKYPLHVAEKDYLLALVLQIITTSSLGKHLIFKGGTALHHCYLKQYRFSEDLDFSSNQSPVSLENLRNLFNKVHYLNIKKDYLSKATVKIEKLQYIGPLIQPNSLKVEIDFLQNVVLPPQTLIYHNVWGVDFTVQVMDIKEICAEKIRAMSDRARYRDFYDLALILKEYTINLEEIIQLVKQKEIRQPISKANIKVNLEIIKTQKEKEMNQIYYSRNIDDTTIKEMVDRLPLDKPLPAPLY